MTRRRQYQPTKPQPTKKERPEQPAEPLTFLAACKHLISVLKWRFSPRKWTGKRVFIYGKMRPVIGETYAGIFVKGLSHEIRKDSRYLIKA